MMEFEEKFGKEELEAKTRANENVMEMLTDMMLAIMPDERKPMYEVPRMAMRVDRAVRSILDLLLKIPLTDNQDAKVAAEAVDFLHSICIQIEAFRDAHDICDKTE